MAQGDNDRLMVCMPPGSGKSTYASRLFPAWFLAQAPRLNIIGASHTMTLAEQISKETQAFVRDYGATLGYELLTEGAQHWTTSNGGSYRAAGINGPITGSRADLAIIDDPLKGRDEADSALYRERAWRWFSADLRSRAKPGMRIVLILTRWHEDDLAGRLLDQQPGRWRVLSLPAIAGESDPLGRAPGEWLWADDPAWPYANELRRVYADYEQTGAMRDWYSLYQQSPRPTEGALFMVSQIAIIDAAPPAAMTVRAWDLAATAQVGTRDPDWTVGIRMSRTRQGAYIIEDVARLRGGPDQVEAAIVNTAARDGASVRISLPQDPGQAGKTQAIYLTRKLAGYMVEATPETGDKATRAAPFASQVNAGNVSMAKAAWNAALLDEMISFPSGSHDDIVDALSRAFSVVGLQRAPMQISADVLQRAREGAAQRGFGQHW